MTDDKYFYFGFASNMLEKRILLSCPEARRKGKGKLKGFKLDFAYVSERWKGAMATLTECDDETVWGAVWEIPILFQESLDRKEGVKSGVYEALDVKVECNGEILNCRAYRCVKPYEGDRRPSPFYKKVIIEGAHETRLPQDYIEILEGIEDNSYSGVVDWNLEL